jgi:hypothetical protein
LLRRRGATRFATCDRGCGIIVAIRAGTGSRLGCFTEAMPKDIIEPDTIASAQRRLRRCEAGIALLQDLLAGLTPRTRGYDAVLTWLHELERSRFCRRLELDALSRERRAGAETDTGVRGQVIAFRPRGHASLR